MEGVDTGNARLHDEPKSYLAGATYDETQSRRPSTATASAVLTARTLPAL
jgi:hypothetical protein